MKIKACNTTLEEFSSYDVTARRGEKKLKKIRLNFTVVLNKILDIVRFVTATLGSIPSERLWFWVYI